MMAKPVHMTQILTLIAVDNLTVLMEEFNCMMYIA